MNRRTLTSAPDRLLLRMVALLAALSSFAATNDETSLDDLTLLPPYPELPPSFWEEHGVLLVLAAILLIALVVAGIWWWWRPRPLVQVPIETQTREALGILRRRTEDGRLLSHVSRVLRRYVIMAFQLPPEELTTSEFCRMIGNHERVGPEFAAAVSEFLRRCDELKFAPAQALPAIGAAERALQLVKLGEERRAHLREAAAADAAARQKQTA